MAKKHKLNTIEFTEAKTVLTKNEGKSTKEKLDELIKSNPKMKISTIASMLSISRQTVYNHLKP